MRAQPSFKLRGSEPSHRNAVCVSPGRWQRRWFVLEEGKLMYFKGQNAEAMFEQLDKDHSVRLCAALQLESSSPQVLITKCLLRAQGFLDHSEVQELCKMLGKKMNQSAVQTAMDEMVRLNRLQPADSVAMPLRQRCCACFRCPLRGRSRAKAWWLECSIP